MKKIFITLLVMIMIASMVSCGQTSVSVPASDTEISQKEASVSSIDELEALVTTDVNETIAELNSEYEELIVEINTYDKYVENIDKVEAFYSQIHETTRNLCIRLREYSISYSQLIMQANVSADEKSDMVDDMYDFVYEDISGYIYDGLYDDLMDDMYDAFYNGIVEDGYDLYSYEVWSDVSSDAYEMWSDCSSDIYDEWSDASSDVYRFWSDVSSAFWNDDMEDLEEDIEKFNGDIETIKNAS